MTSGSPDTNLSVGKGLREREGGKEGVRAAQGLIRHRENEAKSVAGKIRLLLHVQSTSCCC